MSIRRDNTGRPHPRRLRLRHLLAAFALVIVVPVGWSSIASAQESGDNAVEIDHEAQDCIDILQDGGEVKDCQEAPSLILPATNEIIWGALSFAVLFALLAKFAWPGIKQGMENRVTRIRADLDGAEHAKTEAETVLAEYQAQLAEAKAEGARIIEEARQAADQLKSAQQARLDEELAAARAQARSDIDAAKGQAMAELRGEVADIAIGAAEAVVGASLDRDAQLQLIEDYINRVGSATNDRGQV